MKKAERKPKGMRIEDVKVGMKVVPHDKTAGTEMSRSVWSHYLRVKDNGFVVVAEIARNGAVRLVDKTGCNFLWFSPSDITPYKEQNTLETLKIIRNGPATVVIFSDGSKGVAKCHPNDEYNAEFGFLLAYTRAREAQLRRDN